MVGVPADARLKGCIHILLSDGHTLICPHALTTHTRARAHARTHARTRALCTGVHRKSTQFRAVGAAASVRRGVNGLDTADTRIQMIQGPTERERINLWALMLVETTLTMRDTSDATT